MKKYISIIDLGTGSIRNTVYAMDGEEIWSRRYENPLIQPKPGYAEQDPVAWWNILLRSFVEMPSDVKSRVIAISVTSQREGIVPVDASFRPLGKIIIWLDGRSRSEAAYIESVLGREQIYDICGLIPNPAWSLSKILWLRNNEPELFNNAYKFLQAEDYFISRLAGKAVTEFSIASRTCLLDVYNKRWSDKILDTFSIPEHKLPELREPGSFVGYIREEIIAETGLQEDTMIYTGAGDQQAAAVGAGAFGEGMASIGIGTSSAISMTIASPVPDAKKKIILNCAALPGKWEYEPPIWNTGGLIRWFYENITGQHQQYEQLIGDAGKIPPGSEGLIALPYFSGAGSPRWDPELRGCFYGLSLAHNQSHMLRALMESIAFEIRMNIETIRKTGIDLKKIILSGGASQNLLLCQVIADVLKTPVEIFRASEASSFGTFILVRSAIENTGPEEIYGALNTPRGNAVPDPRLELQYDESYDKFIRLGDLMQKYHENKF